MKHTAFKKPVAVLACAALAASMTPAAAFANTTSANSSTEDDSFNVEELSQEEPTAASELLDGAEYVKQQAVILVENASSLKAGQRLSKNLDVASSIEIEDVTPVEDTSQDLGIVTVSSAKLSTEKLIDGLNASDDVVLAEPNFIYHTYSVTDDEYSSYQWSLENTGQSGSTGKYQTNATSAWSQPQVQTGEQVIVSMDTGVDYTHEDLKDNMWVNPFEVADNGIDDDGNGYVDDIYGVTTAMDEYDASLYGSSPMPVGAENTHGTHTAGIMLGKANNGIGISGVNGVSTTTKLMALRISDDNGDVQFSAAVRAYAYIYDMVKRGVNIKAVNCSWGGPTGCSTILEEMINKVGAAGVLSVFATGNEFKHGAENYSPNNFIDGIQWNAGGDVLSDSAADFEGAEVNNSPGPSYPAGLDSPYIVRVTSLDADGNLSPFANYDTDTEEIAASGGEILSTVSLPNFQPNIYSDVASKTSLYLTNKFTFKTVNAYGSAGEVTLNNNSSATYFQEAGGDTHSATITIKNAKKNTPVGVTLNYESSAFEQAPYVYFDLGCTEAPDDSNTNLEAMHVLAYDCDASESQPDIDTVCGSIVEEPYHANQAVKGIWRHISFQSNNAKSTKRSLRIYFIPQVSGDYTLSLDNVAISKGTKNEEEGFGKYAYMSGTSMAAPTVTGALSLIAEKSPSMTALQLKEALFSCTTQLEALDGKSYRSLALDLSKLNSTPTSYSELPYLSSVTCSNGNIYISGSNLKGSTVTVDGNALATEICSNQQIVAPYQGENGEQHLVKVTNAQGYDSKYFRSTKGSAYGTIGTGDFNGIAQSSLMFNDYNFTTDGRTIYKASRITNAIVTYELSDGTMDEGHYTMGTSYTVNMSKVLNGAFRDDSSIPFDCSFSFRSGIDSFQYDQGNIYFIVSKCITGDETEMYGAKNGTSAVVRYNLKTRKTTWIALPSGVFRPALLAHNGKLTIAGGINASTGALLKTVYTYGSSKWTAGASLPAARALGKLVQSGNSVYYVNGTNATANTPAMLVYQNGAWSTSAAEITYSDAQYFTYKYQCYKYYECGVSPVTEGLLFTDRIFNLGDTILYSAQTDTAADYGYYFYTNKNMFVRGLVVGNRYIGSSFTLEKSKISCSSTDTSAGEYSEFRETYLLRGAVSYFDVPDTPFVNVSANTGGYSMETSGFGYHMVGDTATVSMSYSDEGNKYVDRLTVNGKTYKGNVASFKVTDTTTVGCVLLNSKLSSAKVKLSKKKYTYNGKKKKPKVTVVMGNRTLVRGVDYTVKYTHNKKVGTAKVKIIGEGEFYGSKTVKFKIVKKKTKKKKKTTKKK